MHIHKASLSLFVVGLGLSTSAQYCTLPDLSPAAFSSTNFDFLIVGAGPGGLTLASRLSEDPNVTVGVIEAGGVHMTDQAITVPAFSSHPLGNPEYDWNYASIPQPFGANRSIPSFRGRLLGGSSAINGLAWGRPSAVELDGWDQINKGNSGWTFSDLLPYFVKTETVQQQYQSFLPGLDDPEVAIPIQTIDNGTDGALKASDYILASFNVWFNDAVVPYVEAMNEVGIRTNADPRNGNTTGVWNTLLSLDRNHGIRTEAGMTYCFAYNRTNLHVLTNAQATKVTLSGHGRTLGATGVEFVVNGTSGTFSANASREVIISGGAVDTPQLLELSGIGDPKVLHAAGVDTIVDLPGVGANLQEHPYAPSVFQLSPGLVTYDVLNNVTILAEQEVIYAQNGTGILASTNPTLSFATSAQLFPSNVTEHLLSLFDRDVRSGSSGGIPFTALNLAQFAIHREWLLNGNVVDGELLLHASYSAGTEGTSYMSLLGGLMRPLSRGYVHINSSDPTARPVLNPNYLATQYDRQFVTEFLRFHRTLASQEAFNGVIVEQVQPPLNVTLDEALLSYAQQTFSSGAHITGSAAMAPRELGGVVDTELKVYGVKNLRVADCSIFPMQLAVHPQAIVYAIGEKAADMIKATYSSQN